MATSHLILFALVASAPLILVTAQFTPVTPVPQVPQVAPQQQCPVLMLMQKMYSDSNDTVAWYSDLGEMFRILSRGYPTNGSNGTSGSFFPDMRSFHPIIQTIQKTSLGTKIYNVYLSIAKLFQQVTQWFSGLFSSRVVAPGGKPTTARTVNPFSMINFNWVQMIPNSVFGYLNVTTVDCQYRAVCETSQYIISKLPASSSSLFSLSNPSLGLLSLWSSDPYFQAWVSGMLNQNCGLLYPTCPQSPFGQTSGRR